MYKHCDCTTMLTEGATAPEFSLPGVPADQSEGIEQYELAEARKAGPVLINFYLFDFNPQCRRNVCDLHDMSWFDLDSDLQVFGISTDSTFSHREFAKQEGLNFPLLSDNDGSVAEAYEVLIDELQGHKRIARRAIYLIDETGTVRYSWIADSPDTQPDWERVKAVVEAVKT